MKKIISLGLIFGGIALIMYPTVKDINSQHKQKEIVQRWNVVMENLDENIEINNNNKEIDNHIEDKSNRDTEIEEDKQPEIIIKDDEEGILLINKIQFKQPILKGASEENLSVTVSSIESTGEPGNGNYCIAGHRNRDYGKNFNRLDELENGDIIEIYTSNNKFKYSVYDKFRVNPDEVWVLDQKEGQKELTLITCDPIINPDKRLIIKAKLNE